jgi:hypothetical protein
VKREKLKQAIRDELVAFAWEDYGLDDAVSGRTTDWADNLAELITQRVDRSVVIEKAIAYYRASGTSDEVDAHNDLLDAVAALFKGGEPR